MSGERNVLPLRFQDIACEYPDKKNFLSPFLLRFPLTIFFVGLFIAHNIGCKVSKWGMQKFDILFETISLSKSFAGSSSFFFKK